jgi:chemotaxis protein histidine kinase CheA
MQAQLNETPNASTHEVIETNNDLKERCLRPGNENEAARQAIANAEKAMEKLSVNFDDWMATESVQLAKARDTAKSSEFAQKELLELFQAAHNMKGQTTTLGYPFADEICSSLCRLIDALPDKSRLPIELVDQHVDAVRALVIEGAKGTANPKASVLAKRLCDVTNEFLARETASAA